MKAEKIIEELKIEKLKTATAQWYVELVVHCPYCNEYQGDILNEYDEWWDEFGEPLKSKKIFLTLFFPKV